MRLFLLRLSALCLFTATLLAWPRIFRPYTSEQAQPFLSLGVLGSGWLIAFAVGVALIAFIGCRPLFALFGRVEQVTVSRSALCSVLAGVGASGYLAATAYRAHRHLFPAMHDEFSYLIQAHQLASGHLWMPEHPLAKFFDSFQLLVHPVYASAYFPGTAMLYVPGVWLHMAPHFTSLVVSGTIAGLLFWITVQLIGGNAAWLSLLLLLSNAVFRQLSVMTLGQLPLLLYAMAATVLWIKWNRQPKISIAICIGCFLGLAAITRPVDALCFAVPIGILMLLTRRWLSIVAVLFGLLPMGCLQLAMDRGITGHWFETPFGLYARRDYPGTAYGFHPYDTNAQPASALKQKQSLFRMYQKLISDHKPGNVFADLFHTRLRFVLAQQSPAPFPLLVFLCPFALLSLTKIRAAILSTGPLLLLLYAPYVFFMPHYVTVAAPALIVAILGGAQGITNLAGRHQRVVAIAFTLFIGGEALAALPEMTVPDVDVFGNNLLISVNDAIAKLPREAAVILFLYNDPRRSLDEEPVYNADVGWPDDALIIRAHDLGTADAELFNYYKARRSGCKFYFFDEKDRMLRRIKLQ